MTLSTPAVLGTHSVTLTLRAKSCCTCWPAALWAPQAPGFAPASFGSPFNIPLLFLPQGLCTCTPICRAPPPPTQSLALAQSLPFSSLAQMSPVFCDHSDKSRPPHSASPCMASPRALIVACVYSHFCLVYFCPSSAGVGPHLLHSLPYSQVYAEAPGPESEPRVCFWDK